MKTQPILLKLLPVLALTSALSVWEPNPAHADTAGRLGWARNSPAGMDVAQYRQRIGAFATWTRAMRLRITIGRWGTIPPKPSTRVTDITSTYREATANSVQGGLHCEDWQFRTGEQ
jgi:hypothetical protein